MHTHNKNKSGIRAWFLTALAFFTAALSQIAMAGEEAIGAAVPEQLYFQHPASPSMEKIVAFHDGMLIMTTAIAVFVLILLVIVVVRFNAKANPVPSKTTHNTMLEVVWTGIPVLILLVVVIYSMKLLYFVERVPESEMTLKVTGYQWYWGYEYPDNGGINFLSYLVPQEDLKEGQLRLLTTDNEVVLPVDTTIRIQVTAADVLHSFAVPAFGIKIDAVPGKLNETWVKIERPGMYYGQCSELCGQGHGFMPIMIHAVSKEDFANWVKGKTSSAGNDNNNKKQASRE